jgi:hypothetical protein
MERLVIPYNPDSKRGTWMPLTGEEGKPPLIRCPNGHGSVMRSHKIQTDGNVEGSVLCPVPGCNWHVYVKLDEYTERMKGEQS